MGTYYAVHLRSGWVSPKDGHLPAKRGNSGKLRIHFELGQKSHERHQTTVLEALATRGHEIIKTACTTDCPGLIEHTLPTDDHRNLLAFSAFVRDDGWGRMSYLVRTVRDYLRYVRPEHMSSDVISHRARNMLRIGYDAASAEAAKPWLELLDAGTLDIAALERLDRSLDAMEAAIPPHPAILGYVRSIDADVFCVTPMLMTQYGQTDLVKAVRAQGIPIVFLAGSWDNLTTKGTTHIVPDLTLVWNDIQVDEAEKFHAIPRETVKAVGAPRFDDFWEREIEIPYPAFCADYGLDASRQTITYLGSSNLIVKDETSFVRQWIARLRESGSRQVAEANILLRPHPKFTKGWAEIAAEFPRVGISVSKILNNDSTLFHAMAHSRAVVGANTSAELEAAILDCPIFTIKDPAFVSGQDGTIHFGYLAGSLAEVATSLDEHVEQITAEMSRERRKGRNEAFLRSFLRPMGLDRRAADTTAEAIESVARPGSERARMDAAGAKRPAPKAPAREPELAGSLRSLARSIRSRVRI